jgi:gas vesicle protein
MTNKNSSGSGFFSGLLLGFLAGAVAGVLLTDRPGRQLRHDIKSGSSEFLRDLKTKLDEIKEQVNEKFKASAMNIQEQVESLNKQLKEISEAQARYN